METLLVHEPRVDIKEDSELNHVVLQGGQRVTENSIPADSYSNSSANWSIYPPSNTTIVDRFLKGKFFIEVKSDVDFVLGTKEGLRQFPIAAVTDVLNVQINGENVSENVADITHPMLCYGNTADDRVKSWSTTAAQPDQYQKYSDWNTQGTARNVFANYGENSGEMSRGSVTPQVVDSKTLRYEVVEPLLISPLYQGIGPQQEGFVNVNQIQITYRFKDLARVWSSDGTTGTSYTITFYKAPEIAVSYITPDMLQPIPSLQVLPYYKHNVYKKEVSSLTANSTATIYSDSIKLSQVPSRMYLYVKRDDSSESVYTSDSFLGINNINVTFNNQNGLLSACSKSDLFEISRRNGCNLSYQQFSQFRGSVFCLEFGKDIGLSDTLAPGTLAQCTIQVQMSVTNLDTAAFKGIFHLVLTNTGTFSISENQARASLGNLTEQVVLQSKTASDKMSHLAYEDLHGGSFWSSLKNVVHKVSSGISKAIPIATKVASVVAPELAPVISTIGKGASAVSGLTGSGRFSGGSGLSGGRVRRR